MQLLQYSEHTQYRNSASSFKAAIASICQESHKGAKVDAEKALQCLHANCPLRCLTFESGHLLEWDTYQC